MNGNRETTRNPSPASIRSLGGRKLPGSFNTYTRAFLVNNLSFILPALYSSLVKLWIARIDPAMVATTDVFTYISVIAEVLNEGLPRASWSTIGDSSSDLPRRLRLTHTLILTQSLLGLILSLIIFGNATRFASIFVPDHARRLSIIYVQISSFSALTSALETATATATRALDEPDVPFVFNCVKFAANIVLDMLLISTFRVGSYQPTANLQAGIQLACNLASAFFGLGYFLWRNSSWRRPSTKPAFSAFLVLLRPGLFTFVESAVRNTLYLWLVSTIVSLGSLYATAWGVFNTIRWGLIMVPIHALEATTLTFVGHNWGLWCKDMENSPAGTCQRATIKSLYRITRPAFLSIGIALAYELPIYALISAVGARSFARYLSDDDGVAAVTARMWRTLDWCYILYAVSTQLAAVLLATKPRWFMWQSLASNILYVLPWATVCQVSHLDEHNAWTYHALVFGGSLVFSFICIPLVLAVLAWVLVRRGNT
ncbi:hypothetical protein L249_8144 [Ophiocordyceps polyrhachis-furcata BCC 54312]|uniref:Uncharacterized protein n=1 Tax=Ophiocordyceps polyrhachis-furcata BCC 54312 TaxID=1330021 RepID=A0A367LHM4_9HYPO|nr:hypothetical protein L249_8144 [Ophiocordyceps polyrhachis-furcata BCC 54312]